MSVALENPDYISPEAYLEGEKTSEVRHEYISGQVVAMTGASREHETIAGNLFAAIKTHMRGKGCQVFISGMKTRVQHPLKGDKFYYPDLLVSCEPADREHRYYVSRPKLIVEVLSPGTESFDRGNKFADYRRLDSLEEFALIAQDKKYIELFRRDTKENNRRWYLETLEDEGTLELNSIDFSCPLDTVYEDIDWEALATAEE